MPKNDDLAEGVDESFEHLLDFLRDSRGFDFTGYKRNSLMRRCRHRMDQIQCATFEDYLDVLQTQPDEFEALFNTILINVTAFFRDPDAWNVIREQVIPKILADRAPGDPIRVWSAGCASGQEAYTLAIILAEALGPDELRRRVKIYATDVDEHALAVARAGTYDAEAVKSLPPEWLSKYFEPVNSHFTFRKDLRRVIIFGRNDLVKDAPISRVDLLVCRNTLMYLNAETQRNVLGRLNFALAPNGTLFLGHAEMLLNRSERFSALDIKNRIFTKAAGSPTKYGEAGEPRSSAEREGQLTGLETMRDLAFRSNPLAQIVVNGQDTVAMINQQAEISFGLSARDIGRLLQDLPISYRPVELRSYIERARVERLPARISDVEWSRDGGEATWFEIHVNPLVDTANGILGVSIVFFDVTSTRTLLEKIGDTNNQLESAYGELQSTNEELETTNEELQSTVEELETTNEELQSTNEELETMNEELQSTNDQLQSINTTLQTRTVELVDARTFMDSLIESIPTAMVIVDREMRVLVWNEGCKDLWGVGASEAVGSDFPTLDIGLPMDSIRPLIGNAFVDPNSVGEVAIVDAVNRRGRATSVRVTCTAFKSSDGKVSGALLMMKPTSDR